MSFPFQIPKATEVAAAFLEKAGGTINVMKLIKLIYLLDRQSIAARGIPVLGGWYVSMKNGPVTSEVLDLINSGRLGMQPDKTWTEHIGARREYTVALLKPAARQRLSDLEVEMIDQLWQEHGKQDQWELMEWCHAHCPEWSEISGGYQPIELSRLTDALGKTREQYAHIAREANELAMLDEIFSR